MPRPEYPCVVRCSFDDEGDRRPKSHESFSAQLVRGCPVPRQSFLFGIPVYLTIIGHRQGLIRALERWRDASG